MKPWENTSIPMSLREFVWVSLDFSVFSRKLSPIDRHIPSIRRWCSYFTIYSAVISAPTNSIIALNNRDSPLSSMDSSVSSTALRLNFISARSLLAVLVCFLAEFLCPIGFIGLTASDDVRCSCSPLVKMDWTSISLIARCKWLCRSSTHFATISVPMLRFVTFSSPESMRRFFSFYAHTRIFDTCLTNLFIAASFVSGLSKR